MEHAASRFRTDYERAVMFRDGLTLATLIYRPYRISNFASITLDEHLRREGRGWRLAFPAAEVKNKLRLESPWPDELIGYLERYLELHRAVLLESKSARAPTMGLWVAKGGAQMTSSVLAYRITKRTAEEFGTAINPHTFRHIVATMISIENPEGVTDIAGVLGHRTSKTGEKFYNKAKGLVAGDLYQAEISRVRKAARAHRR